MRQEGCSTSHAAGRRLGVSSPSWSASAQLVKLCIAQCTWLLKRLAFAEVGEMTSYWHKNMNCYRATVVCLDAKGLWKPGQSFILAGFALSLPRSTIDTGCDPALLRDCVDHPADCKPLQNYNLFKFALIQPSSLNHDKFMKLLRGAWQRNLFCRFFSVSQSALIIFLHEIV